MDNSQNHPINCGLATTENFPINFEKQEISNRSVDIDYQYVNRITVPVNQTQIQVGEINFLNSVNSTSVQDVFLEISQKKDFPITPKSSTSLNESILAPNTGEINPSTFYHVSDGSTVIITELENGEKYAKSVTTETLDPATTNNFSSFVGGSFVKAVTEETEAILTEESSPLSHYAYYSSYGSPNYVRNENCWFADFDLSGLCVLTGSGNTRMITMITPHFGVSVRHYFDPQFGNESQVGKSVNFADPQGNIFSSTIESVNYLNSPVLGVAANEVPYFDIAIIKLNNPVPNSIKKYKIFPSNISPYFPCISNGRRQRNGVPESLSEMAIGPKSMFFMPCVGVSHYRWDSEYTQPRNNRFVYLCRTNGASVTTFQENNNLGYTYPLLIASPNPPLPPLDSIVFGEHAGAGFDYISHPEYPNYNGASSWFRGGDSGGPLFCILNGDLVLMGNHVDTRTSHLYGGGTQIYLQNKINELSNNSEAAETVDLSGFSQFTNPESWENLLDPWTISIN